MEQGNPFPPITFKERADFWKRFCDSTPTFALGEAIQDWYKENHDQISDLNLVLSAQRMRCWLIQKKYFALFAMPFRLIFEKWVEGWVEKLSENRIQIVQNIHASPHLTIV